MPVFCLLLSYNDYLPNALYPNQPESSDGGGNIVSSMLLIKLLPLKFTFLKLHMIQYWCNWNKARLQVIVRLKLKKLWLWKCFQILKIYQIMPLTLCWIFGLMQRFLALVMLVLIQCFFANSMFLGFNIFF